MKAEHRKELQTNALADRMGRLLQRMKTPPKKRSLLLWLLVIAAVVAVGVWWYGRRQRSENEEKQWTELELTGSFPDLTHFVEVYKTSPQARMARFQRAWILTWEAGVKSIAANPEARRYLEAGIEEYGALAEEVKD